MKVDFSLLTGDSTSQNSMLTRLMSPEEFPRTWGAAEEILRLKQTSALAIGFWQMKRPQGIHALALGQTRWLPDTGRPVDCSTWFDWASITKLLSATLFARLVDRGWVDWRTPVASILPEFPRDLEFFHLLSHSAGYPAVAPFYREIASAFYPKALHQVSFADRQSWVRERLAGASRLSLAGERVLYSDYSFLILGIALEVLMGGLPLRHLFESYLLNPLQLQEVGFFSPQPALLQPQELNIAATEICHFRGGLIQGEVHDENAWVLGGLAAHAGAFGSIGGLLGFGAKLLQGDGLSGRVREEMWTPIQIRGELQGRTLVGTRQVGNNLQRVSSLAINKVGILWAILASPVLPFGSTESERLRWDS
jgi:CubicO group peptidase (beta-lactamase class C family)